jgi:phage terminase large subunit-like protein
VPIPPLAPTSDEETGSGTGREQLHALTGEADGEGRRFPAPDQPQATSAANRLLEQRLLQLEHERLTLQVQIKERENELMHGLPHLYAWKNYKWAREYIESTNRMCLLVAANQISKSSTNIRKCITWATSPHLWPRLWAIPPTQFWYMYPSNKQLQVELETKWLQFLPKGRYKDDTHSPDGSLNIYKWKLENKLGVPYAINFENAGLRVYFKTYNQDSDHLQSATVDAVFADEEMPEDIYDEVQFRVNATDGYFNMVFTATRGEELWRLAMEPEEGEKVNFPNAQKWQVSAYECLEYEDGTKSHWTIEKINKIIEKCSDEEEVQRRVFGRFIVDREGKIFGGFSIKRNMMPPRAVPSDWLIHSAVDMGSGGNNHPAAIGFLAVSPDLRRGEFFDLWRGNDVITDSGDVLRKYQLMRGNRRVVRQVYDWAAKDFGILASRAGESFEKAQKGHDEGEDLLNTLFSEGRLMIHDTPMGRKMATELTSLKKITPKNKRKDDLADVGRYAARSVNWDMSEFKDKSRDLLPMRPKTRAELELDRRRGQVLDIDAHLDQEFEEINADYGT